MPDFPCIVSNVNADGIDFSVCTEAVVSEKQNKIVTQINSEKLTFLVNVRPEGKISEDSIRGSHRQIVEKLSSFLASDSDLSEKNNWDYAVLYSGKQFANYPKAEQNMAENIRKILVFDVSSVS